MKEKNNDKMAYEVAIHHLGGRGYTMMTDADGTISVHHCKTLDEAVDHFIEGFVEHFGEKPYEEDGE